MVRQVKFCELLKTAECNHLFLLADLFFEFAQNPFENRQAANSAFQKSCVKIGGKGRPRPRRKIVKFKRE
jgi:hypothetical protein